MRRLSVIIAILGFAIASPAAADPFGNVSSRVQEYDAQPQPSPRSAPPQSAGPARQQFEPVPMDGGYYQDGEPGEYYPGEDWGPYDGATCGPSCDCSGWGPTRRWGPCGDCCLGPGFYGRAEYLVWWVRGAYVPPLVTTSPAGTDDPGVAGVLPGASILFGDQNINTDARSGGRFTLGYWCDPCQELGIEDTFFFIGGEHDGYSNFSGGSPILARPFFNTDDSAQDAVLLAFPGVVTGGIDISSSRTVISNEVNVRRLLWVDCCRRIDVLVGYRYFNLGEDLNINQNTTSGPDGVNPGAQFAINDNFETNNNFNGAQLGLNWKTTYGCWSLDVLGKVALGGVSQRARITGSTVITDDTGSASYDAGLLALASNIGNHNQTTFGVLPELNVNLRYQWTPLWRVSIGYTFMALTNVLRPGDQISLNLDPDQFPPPAAAGTFPAFTFNESDVWLQGLNFGIECDF